MVRVEVVFRLGGLSIDFSLSLGKALLIVNVEELVPHAFPMASFMPLGTTLAGRITWTTHLGHLSG